MSDFERFKSAVNELKDTLTKEFGVASGGPVDSVGVNAAKTFISKNEYGIVVLLVRDPTEEEKKSMPERYQGFDVEYIQPG